MTLNLRQKSTEEITAKVWALVNGLPQREAIVQSDAKAWIDEVVALHGEMAIWHAVRLNGFGGSEIGVLVRNKMGMQADFSASAHDIVAGKLMRQAPTKTNANMLRGHENEAPHALRFYQKYGAVRNEELFNRLTKAQGKRPWMRYSPDDLVSMPVALVPDGTGVYYPSMECEGNRLWLIDYKAPTSIHGGEDVAFQYSCQLTQGAILCAEAGIKLDGMMLSQYDWANWALKDDVVGWNPDLGRMVMAAGDAFWNDFVLKGTVPDYIRKKEADGLENYKHEFQNAATLHANVIALADATKKRGEEIRDEILTPLKTMRLGSNKVTFGVEGSPVLTISSKQMMDRNAIKNAFTPEQLDACSEKGPLVYDTDALVAYIKLVTPDVNLKEFKKRELDATKVYAMACKLGLNADELVKEQLTVSASKTIKGQMQDYVDQYYPLSAARPQSEINQENFEALASASVSPVDGQDGHNGNSEGLEDDEEFLAGVELLSVPAG